MKISHFSDTHGLPRKPVHQNAELVVHSGDMMPNRTRGHRAIEPEYQLDWMRKVVADWARWLDGRPFVFVAGNHDFIDPVPIMRRAGIDAQNVEGGVVWIGGVTFAGIPDIPWMGGEWNHERTEEEIGDRFAAVMNHRPDVLVCHVPPYGVLDQPYRGFGDRSVHIGSAAIANVLTYGEHEPKAYLCGHCHEDGGREEWLRGTRVSNAATTRRLVEVPDGR